MKVPLGTTVAAGPRKLPKVVGCFCVFEVEEPALPLTATAKCEEDSCPAEKCPRRMARFKCLLPKGGPGPCFEN